MNTKRVSIDPNEFTLKPVWSWAEQWFLLTCGDFEKSDFNMMTVAWGSFGVMWAKPFVQAVVRPSRYTHEFMEKYDTFTLSALPEKYRSALTLCGTKSGRDIDKVAESGLHPVASLSVPSPTFEEAELVIECRKIYRDEFKPELFLDPDIEPKYGGSDYHTVYFGEIIGIQSIDTYRGR